MTSLRSLEVDGFRNLRDVQLRPHSRLNFLVGANGSGKTGLLESIHYAIRGKSFRTASSGELVVKTGDRFLIRTGFAESIDHPQGFSAAVLRPRNQKQQIRWNDEPANGFREVSSLVPLQVFLPTVGELIFGSPAMRRRWLDWGTFHVEHSYLGTWRRYSKILAQRNAVLRDWQVNPDSALLATYTTMLLELAAQVTEQRESYIAQWMVFHKRRFAWLLADFGQKLEIELKPNGVTKPLSLGDLLSESRSREVKSGVTQWGPHRAELELTIEGQQANQLVSRGQGKLLALAMMLAQADVVSEISGKNSLFLVDDVDAELDPANLARFMTALEESRSQIFLTATSRNSIPTDVNTGHADHALFHVEHGLVRQET